MFDLKEKIAQWRQQMLAAGIQSPVPLEELEGHLHEEIERQLKSGLDEQTAFNSAMQTIGSAPTLQIEFMKIESTQEIRRWKLFEVLFLATTFLIPLIVGSQAFYFKDGGFSEMAASQQAAILAAAITFSLLTWVMQMSCRKFSVILTKPIRDAIFVPVLLWVVACIILLPHCAFSDSQKSVISMWAFVPFGIVIGWAWGFAATARKRLTPAGS